MHFWTLSKQDFIYCSWKSFGASLPTGSRQVLCIHGMALEYGTRKWWMVACACFLTQILSRWESQHIAGALDFSTNNNKYGSYLKFTFQMVDYMIIYHRIDTNILGGHIQDSSLHLFVNN